MNTTATVETLTAEVHVLMVGNRQITLSVYRQLDKFDAWSACLSQFVPFGRVRSGTKYNDLDRRDRPVKREATYEFVGREVNGNALLRIVLLPGDLPLDDKDDALLVRKWDEELPLIVLAGLR